MKYLGIRQVTSALLLLGSLLASPSARAHGGFFRAFEILRSGANPDRIVLRSDVWGFSHSWDGGRTWQWSCSEVYGASSTSTSHVAMALLPDDRLIVANGFRGVRYTDDYCNWAAPAGLGEESVSDLTYAGGTNVVALTSTGQQDGVDNGLWKSEDRGASFTRFGGPMPTDIVTQSLALAPSDAARVYAVGLVTETSPPVGVLLRSDDGGQTFQRFTAPSKDATVLTLRISAVHPANPDVVFVRVDLPEDIGKDEPDELWVTADGGASWKQAFSGSGDLPGLALSPDGERVAISGSVDGVWTGAVTDLIRDGGSALAQTRTLPIWGLLWQDQGLYGGNDNFPPRGTPEAFTFGVSGDEGRSFEEITNVCQIRFGLCSAESDVVQVCTALWDDPSQAGGFIQDFWERSGRCPAEPSPDAGTPPPAEPPADDGCCAVVRPSRTSPLEALLALTIGILAFSARRWSRRSRTRV